MTRSGRVARCTVPALALVAVPVIVAAQHRHTTSSQGDITPPRIVRVVQAQYPPEALRPGEDAVVRLGIDVDDSGRVTAVTILTSSGRHSLDEAAVAAAREFEFEPARRYGRAVPSRIVFRYRFTAPAPRATDEDAPRPLPTLATSHTPSVPFPQPSAANRTAEHRTVLTSHLPSNSTSEPGVTVFARTPSREIFRREVTAEEVRRIPGARGDALLALQNLPGVARPPFGLGQFIVRSSPPDDTLVTLEGQPIALPFHFGGLASAIATDLIERIEFLPGNFSSRYGRVAGGVINVTLRAPSRDRIRAVADIDPIDAGLYTSVPLGRNASVGIGARASFLHLFAPWFAGTEGISFRQWPAYWDYQLALDWETSPSDSFRIVASGIDDRFVLDYRDPNANDPNVRGEVGTHLGYHGIQVRWRHRFSPTVLHTFAPGIAYNLSAARLGPEVRYNFQTLFLNLRDEIELRVGRQTKLFLGTDTQVGLFDNVVHAPPVSTNGIVDPIDPSTIVHYTDQRRFFNTGLYAETEIHPTNTLRLQPGIRVDHYSLLGATTVDPRITVRIAPHPNVTLRTGLGLYSTPPRGWTIIPGFGNPDLQPERWIHTTVGMNIDILPGIVDFDTSVFVKLGDHVVVPSDQTRQQNDGTVVPVRFANTGRGRVFGGEWMLRVRPGRIAPVYALVSYTLQRATRSPCQLSTCPWITYDYDQPHILSATAGIVLPHGWEAGLRVRYTSGLVEPTVTGALYDADHDVALTLTNPLAPGRLPPFFAMDCRVSWRFRLGPVRAQAILEVLNTLNTQNPESRIYSYDRRESRFIYGLPILPSLGIRAEY